MKGFVIFFPDFRYNFPNIFNIISKSFGTYECCHSCLSILTLIVYIIIIFMSEKLLTGQVNKTRAFEIQNGLYSNRQKSKTILNTILKIISKDIKLGS